MMTKNCEICGVTLEDVRNGRKYCPSCAKKASYMRKKARQKGEIPSAGTILCKFCGKPLKQKNVNQKYHAECAYEARLQLIRKSETPRTRSKKVEEPKKNAFPSIAQVQRLADKLGKHYGEVSRMLANGELEYKENL